MISIRNEICKTMKFPECLRGLRGIFFVGQFVLCLQHRYDDADPMFDNVRFNLVDFEPPAFPRGQADWSLAAEYGDVFDADVIGHREVCGRICVMVPESAFFLCFA